MKTSIRAALVFFWLLLLCLFSSPTWAANRFGICTVTCTWDGASTAMWAATSGGATGASVPGSGDTVTFDAATCVGGVTCTITVNTTVTVQSITGGACTASTTGCILDFSANNNNVALSVSLSYTGTGTRTLNLGNGTWTITGTTAAAWDISTVTNLTFNRNSSTIVMNNTPTATKQFRGGGLTYNVVSFGANLSPTFISAAAHTFATLNLTAPVTLILPQGLTTTITNAPTWAGNLATSPLAVSTSNPLGAATLSIASGTVAISGAAIMGIAATGGATFTATSSVDNGLNTGITITAPVLGGGGSMFGG